MDGNSPSYWKIGFSTILTLLLLVPATLFQNRLFAQEHDLPHTLYTTNDGIPDGMIAKIGKDSLDFIWFSHGNSYSRFDGQRFHSYDVFSVHGGGGAFLDQMIHYANGDMYFRSVWSVLKYDPYTDFFENILYTIHDDQPEISHPQGFRHLIGETFWIFEHGQIRTVKPLPDSGYLENRIDIPEADGLAQGLTVDPNGEIWVGTLTGLHHARDSADQLTFTHYRLEVEGLPNPNLLVWHVYSAAGKLWMLGWNGLIEADIPPTPEAGEDLVIRGKQVNLENEAIDLYENGGPILPICMAWDGREFFYFRTWTGIYRWSTQSHETEWIFKEKYYKYHGFMQSLFYDVQGLLWAGTEEGLLKINLGNRNFLSTRLESANPGILEHPLLTHVLIDRKGHLWIGADGDGLYHAAPDSNGDYSKFDQYIPAADDPKSIHGWRVDALFEDSQGRLWVESAGDDNMVQQIIPGTNGPEFRDITPSGSVWQIMEYPGGLLLLNQGFDISMVHDPETGETLPFYLDKEKTRYATVKSQLCSDSLCYLTAIKNLTLHAFYEMEGPLVKTDGSDPHYYPSKIRMLLDSTDITNIYNEFLVTEHVGYKEMWRHSDQRKKTKCFRWESGSSDKPVLGMEYDTDELLSHNTVNDIFRDSRKRIWFSTDGGLTCLDPDAGQAFRFYREDGLPGNNLSWTHAVDQKGLIYLGTESGLVRFHPDSLQVEEAPQVHITGMKLFGETIPIGEDAPLERAVLFSDRITLNHKQNFLSMEYAAMDLSNPRRVQYKYKLEGLDPDWVNPDESRPADYPNLRRGHYTFRVIASNSNGVWNTVGDSFRIRIRPAPWFSWWAFSIYCLLFIWLLMRYRNNLYRRARIRAELDMERIQKEKVEEINQMKSRFFANISHEFRTPLSLIMGPVEDLMKKGRDRVEISPGQLKIIHRNSRRLLGLIKQLLDLSRIESGEMKLRVGEGDLTEFVRTIVLSFLSLAESREISYTYELPEADGKVYFDPDKVEKILNNLLSNAFKFTPDKGRVEVRLEYSFAGDEEPPSGIVLSVSDSGPGIPREQLDRIFERFYQVDSDNTRMFEGAGIGLSLVKELTDIYRGELDVKSEEGKGSVFKVSLPCTENQFRKEEITEDLDILASPGQAGLNSADTEAEIPEEDSGGEAGSSKGDQTMILIVEDHAELRNYIRQHLDHEFRIQEAENGKDGLDKATQLIPDLVISDLMMPEMDGMELCKRMREDARCSHIPLIMLTAKADRNSKIEGLEAGADDYLVKPFDAEELQARVRNLIRQRNRLKEKFNRDFILPDPHRELKSAEDRFLEKATDIIRAHLSNSEFTVEEFSQELGMSSTHLYRKLQGIAGLSPSHFIRNLRLKQAAVLLEKGSDNISRIAYEVGFSDPSYFSKCFRELFGHSPTAHTGM